MSRATITNATDSSFEANVSSGYTLMDFWAPWCGPCRAVAPVLDQVAEKYEGRLTVAKLNVDDNPESAGRFGIRSIPTLLLFRDGNLIDGIVGAPTRPQLEHWLDERLVLDPTA